ncbi:MAG: hypothetical protein WBN92_06355, partial [Terriglobia bacterium]
MEPVFEWLVGSKVGVFLLSSAGAALIALFVSEITRVRRKRRLLQDEVMPPLEVRFKGGEVSVSIQGNYGVTNLSDLPIHMNRPHILGYNLASRSFQFRITPGIRSNAPLFEELSIPPNSEAVLISSEDCLAVAEHWREGFMPRFIWLEILQEVRIASKRSSQWKAHLYRRTYFSEREGSARFQSTGTEINSQLARCIAF